MTSLNLISYVCETRKFVMAILLWKQGLSCDKSTCISVKKLSNLVFTELMVNLFNLIEKKIEPCSVKKGVSSICKEY